MPVDVAAHSGSFHNVSSYSGFFSGNGWRPGDAILPSLFGRTEGKGATPEIPEKKVLSKKHQKLEFKLLEETTKYCCLSLFAKASY